MKYCEICNTFFKTMLDLKIHRNQLRHFKVSAYDLNEKSRQEQLRANKDFSVQCLICYTFHKQITNRHLKKHNTFEQYKIMFPKAPTISEKTLEKQRNKRYTEEAKDKIRKSHLERLKNPIIEFNSFKVFIEIDGNYWHNYPKGLEKDIDLDEYCQKNNIKIFRFWETDIIKDKQKCADKVTSYVIDQIWFFDAIEIFGKNKIYSKEFHEFLYGVEEIA